VVLRVDKEKGAFVLINFQRR
jgi:translation initiation factor 2 subunit 1